MRTRRDGAGDLLIALILGSISVLGWVIGWLTHP